MPLILNDPVGCKHSIFNHTDLPSAASTSASRKIGVWVCSEGISDTWGIVADLSPVNTRTLMLSRQSDQSVSPALMSSRRQTHRRNLHRIRPLQTRQVPPQVPR